MILSAKRLLDQQRDHNYRLAYGHPISTAWEDERFLINMPLLITVGNIVGKKQKHGY